jgi:Rod binding domain-containing protein
MTVAPLHTHPVDAADLPLDHLAASTQVPEQDKVAEVSRAFEAVLLRQILSQTQRPVFPSKFIGNSTTDGIYRDLVVNQLAESISKSGSFGLARSLAGDLQRQSSVATAAAPNPPAARTARRNPSNHD